jgi:hypothetical protein
MPFRDEYNLSRRYSLDESLVIPGLVDSLVVPGLELSEVGEAGKLRGSSRQLDAGEISRDIRAENRSRE